MIVVDARGHRCPVPSLMLRKAMANACAGAELELIATDPMARIDIPHLLAEGQARLVELREAEGMLTFRVVMPDAMPD